MNPIVSIVTVSYNAIRYIKPTLDSVVSQTYPNIEYIIIDGGSKDGTLNMLYEYASYFSYFVSEPDAGIYDAMNKAIKVAKGDWIIFMNAGDSFVDSKVLERVFSSVAYKDMDVIYGDTIVKYPWGNCSIASGFFGANDINLPFCHQSVFVRTSLMKKYPFDLSYKVAADYNFFYTLYKQERNFLHIDVPISLYDAIGFSTNRVVETYKEVAKINGSRCSIKYIANLFGLYFRYVLVKIIPSSFVAIYRKNKYHCYE